MLKGRIVVTLPSGQVWRAFLVSMAGAQSIINYIKVAAPGAEIEVTADPEFKLLTTWGAVKDFNRWMEAQDDVARTLGKD